MPATTKAIDPTKLCGECAGNGFVPTFDMAISICGECKGSGYRTAVGDLGQTHSEPVRPYSYEPACRRLTLVKGKKPTTYTVGEFTPDSEYAGKDARAFNLTKTATGEAYCVLIGRGEMSCDCPGKSYEASARANQRAYYAGEKLFKTLGCKHLDSIAVLLRDGWLDLPEGNTPSELDETLTVADMVA